ncbi:MAG: hypothetical protein ACPGTI_07895 [bacterium]
MSTDPKAPDDAQALVKDHEERVKLAVQNCKERLEELTGMKVMVSWIGVDPAQKTRCEMTVPTGLNMIQLMRLAKEKMLALVDLQVSMASQAQKAAMTKTPSGIITPNQ